MTVSPRFIDSLETPTWIPRWIPATWDDYLAYRDEETPLRRRLFFIGDFFWFMTCQQIAGIKEVTKSQE